MTPMQIINASPKSTTRTTGTGNPAEVTERVVSNTMATTLRTPITSTRGQMNTSDLAVGRNTTGDSAITVANVHPTPTSSARPDFDIGPRLAGEVPAGSTVRVSLSGPAVPVGPDPPADPDPWDVQPEERPVGHLSAAPIAAPGLVRRNADSWTAIEGPHR